MRGLIVVVMGLVCACSAGAEEVLEEFSWEGSSRFSNDEVPGVVVVETKAGVQTTVLTIEKPGVTKATYALVGEVKYEGVEGVGHLEMWNYFPNGGRFFSRTLADRGAMAALKGTSDWRPFVVPFYTGDETKQPNRITLDVVLPGKGKVSLGTIRLVQYAKGEDPLAVGGAWWSGPVGGIIGGAFGVVFGCLGGVIGWLSHKGKARSLVLTMVKGMFVIGVGALALAIAALVCGQPYAVYYPPLLVGILLTILPLALLSVVRKLYEQAELRKMEALDAP